MRPDFDIESTSTFPNQDFLYAYNHNLQNFIDDDMIHFVVCK